MGSAKQETLTIDISLEHEDSVARAQKWLKGVVTLEVHDNDVVLDESKDHKLTVELIGREVTKGANSKMHTIDIFHESSVRSIMERDKLTAHCQYNFPFSIYAPGDIPPTMTYKDRNFRDQQESSCSVSYKLTASFESYCTERKIQMIGQPVSNKAHPVTVEASIAPVITQSFSWRSMLSTAHRTRKISPHAEHHHGCLIWAARIKNTHVGKGQEVNLAFSLRNASSYDVVKLSARLVEKVSWKTAEGQMRSQATELEYTLMPNLTFLNNQKATLSKHQSQLVHLDHALAKEMIEDLTLQENTVRVPIPEKCRDSYKGKFIQVSHYLVIEARTAHAEETATDPNHTATLTMELPVKVFDPSTVDQRHHQPIGDFDVRNPQEVAEIVMTKWPAEEDDALQASFTSVDDTSWDASDEAICVPQIREVPREE
mmetsp:Transcript_15029/g.32767  ORF Transcript_15029/g.32767 Transcript_15029/m.32767 type:complete len:429 (-) Transcript_15029:94-1380(-)|eukprot:CAMPEP_0168795052 /NCGR_PEP_ID=MMETSP0725-20121227/15975_1 /TAXON_ID=265536 /ORGANISM="Amphiprora sp., Strain CCMP467" /LENGTH=428 /DNA_ID=CAMNT_0008845993 /DNA_START=119 /DNA_END=1405 /DNA_ORIENTATION=-